MPGDVHKTTDALPSFDECEAAVKSGGASALQRFIYDNEPAGRDDEQEFRAGLAAVLAEAMNREATRAQ